MSPCPHPFRFYVRTCPRWFMISRLVGNVCQRAPSLFHRVSLRMKPQVVFVLGGPGAGKGTQCSNIVAVRRMGREKTLKTESFDGRGLAFL